MFMTFSSDADIRRIARAVVDLTLPRAEWTHEAHVAVAAWLMCCGDYDAFRDLPRITQAYKQEVGTPNTDSSGFHETITHASLRAIRHFLREDPEDGRLFERINRLFETELGDPDWVLNYWSRERIFSVEARRAWAEPDNGPLPYE